MKLYRSVIVNFDKNMQFVEYTDIFTRVKVIIFYKVIKKGNVSKIYIALYTFF